METKIPVYFAEATPELMEEETLKMVMAAGGVLYKGTANGCHTVVSHAPDNSGYAQINRMGKNYRLHKVAWMQHHGPIPDGHGVYQTCRNRRCINPAHLMLGTPTEIRQEARKGRIPEGETLTTIPLTARDKELINRLAHYGASRRTVTLAFGISRIVFDQLREDKLGLAL